jgi:hypothetical protein
MGRPHYLSLLHQGDKIEFHIGQFLSDDRGTRDHNESKRLVEIMLMKAKDLAQKAPSSCANDGFPNLAACDDADTAL